MPKEALLPCGVYEKLLDQATERALSRLPGLEFVFDKLEETGTPHAYSQHFWNLLRQALPILPVSEQKALLNRLVVTLSENPDLPHVEDAQLLASDRPILKEIRTTTGAPSLPRPSTPLSVSSLLTGSSDEPALEHELRAEMASADRVDILVSFVKFSGLRLLKPAFQELSGRGVPVRIITTSYMGASDPEAVEWLAAQPGFEVRVSYDTERTRLHAKAYHFHRNSGFSTAYIGSANMSKPAMTSGLEWTMKVTAPDMPHVLERFTGEFEAYWNREEFRPFDESHAETLREAVQNARSGSSTPRLRFFAEIRPHDFQRRILEALQAEREAGFCRNLVVAATGTGKTVIAALDYARECQAGIQPRLLFMAHRKEILEQALDCFRLVLRDPNFGELFVDGMLPTHWQHVFASVQSLRQKIPWQQALDHFAFVVLDEAHHGAADSYRYWLQELRPKILLGLTATPERMDGSSILPDFDHRFAAEIRLAEALDEKLLCPFHYFGITDPVSTADERFWKAGKYSVEALTEVYTGDDIRAVQRLDVILQSLRQYQPELKDTRALGFCVSVKHAHFMADKFRQAGLQACVLLGETESEERRARLAAFARGEFTFLFTVDVFNEGVDIPEINLVMFLRPTDSLTVFLQQLGRGLRHAPGKDCLTVLDFVGHSHRKYRLDRKFAALLRTHRQRIDREIEQDFPNLPPGCNIQLERVAKDHILQNIGDTLGRLNNFIPEAIRTHETETGTPLTFPNFLRATGLSPLEVLKSRTWSEWKALAWHAAPVEDTDLEHARKALRRLCLRDDTDLLQMLANLDSVALPVHPKQANALHFMLWGQGEKEIATSLTASFERWLCNKRCHEDLKEIIAWRRDQLSYPTPTILLPGKARLRLHASYGYAEIKALFGLATFEKKGPQGVGVMHVPETKVYLHLVTFRKAERDFSPTTRYQDYLISPTLLHWQSQANTTQDSPTGQNYLHFRDRGYTVLFFARLDKNTENETSPFLFLGPGKTLLSAKGNRPISMIWELSHAVPAAFYETARI
jgi:superfamily II DNA or RNA helicase